MIGPLDIIPFKPSRVISTCILTHDAQDADNNTIFHLLASVPSPPTLSPFTHLLLSSPNFPPMPPTKSHEELTAISCRMTEIYHTLFPFLLDWSNSGGKTALHVAAQAGNASFISLLCDLGADVDLTDLQGNSPLHYASAWGHIDSIQVLLERGCQFAARNFEGFTASDFAYSNTVMKALQDFARDVFEERRNRRNQERLGERSTSSLGRGEQTFESSSYYSDRRGREGNTPPIDGGYNAGYHMNQATNSHSNSTSNARLRSGSVSTSTSQGSRLSSGTRYMDPSQMPPIPTTSSSTPHLNNAQYIQSYPDVRRSAISPVNDGPSSITPQAREMTRMPSDGPLPPRPYRMRTGSASQYPQQSHHPAPATLGVPLPPEMGYLTNRSTSERSMNSNGSLNGNIHDVNVNGNGHETGTPSPNMASNVNAIEHFRPPSSNERYRPSPTAGYPSNLQNQRATIPTPSPNLSHNNNLIQPQHPLSTQQAPSMATTGQSPILQLDQIPRRTREGSLSSTYSASAIGGGSGVTAAAATGTGVGLGITPASAAMRRGGSGHGSGPSQSLGQTQTQTHTPEGQIQTQPGGRF